MTVANLKIGKQKFVVVPERDFDRLQKEVARYRRRAMEDQMLGQLAEKELRGFRKSGRKGIPWEKVRKNLGL